MLKTNGREGGCNVDEAHHDYSNGKEFDSCNLFHLLNYKTTWIKIAIETAIGGGELQDAIVRVGHTTGIVLLVAITPNHLLALGIRQYLHRTAQHHALETLSIAEIDRGLGVSLVLSHTY